MPFRYRTPLSFLLVEKAAELSGLRHRALTVSGNGIIRRKRGHLARHPSAFIRGGSSVR
jgi:hypothetical protein